MNQINVSRRANDQQALFPLAGAPDGLLFEPEIMTAMEEATFLCVIKTLPFGAFRMHGVDAKRRVVRFGVHYLAGSAEMTPASDFPLSLEPLRARTACGCRCSDTPLIGVTGNGVRTRGWDRLASRFATVRHRGRDLIRRRRPDALSAR